jgi:hypothetical protein
MPFSAPYGAPFNHAMENGPAARVGACAWSDRIDLNPSGSNMENLIELIRSAIPYPGKIIHLEAQASGVSFSWNHTDFFVDGNLAAFEVKGNTLYITSASILLQAILRRVQREKQRELKEQEQREQEQEA